METKQKTGTKDKRRNNEKRKEKSRDAARCRRSKETEIFADLAAALPVNQDQVAQLDKASIMRLAISYLRVRDMVDLVNVPANVEKNSKEDESLFLKSLEGFVMVLSNDGDFVYLSENVSEYLGIGQIDLIGQNIYDYSHPCDHEEIKELLSRKAKDEANNLSQKSFFIRLKCTLTSKGRSVNLKSASYKVLHCQGHMLRDSSDLGEADAAASKKLRNCFAAVANPIPHPSNIEAPLPKQTFVTKHGLDMKFVHADDEIMKEVLGYKEDELLGKSVYEYHHAMDSDAICAAYKCLFSKGQCETGKYRFLAKNGGFVWVSTQATLIYDKMQKPQNVVCVNYVISGVECENEIYSATQLSATNATVVTSSLSLSDESEDKNNNNNISNINKPYKEKELDEELELEAEEEEEDNSDEIVTLPVAPEELLNYLDGDESSLFGPRRNTEKILTVRTKEMSTGFLTFTEDSGLTMLKEEPEDLTHLAPVAGDVCVPLEEHPFLSDVLDDLLLKDNLSPLMMDEPMDPFISYRESYSPELLSPNFSKNSDSSLPSLLNSPSNSLGDDDHMPASFLNYDDRSDNSSMRPVSPYIPMHMDDLPLLLSTSNDLMWGNCGNGSAPPSPTRKITLNQQQQHQQQESSSLAQLLSGTDRTAKQQSDHIGQSRWGARASSKTSIRTHHATTNGNNKRANSGNVALNASSATKRMKTSDVEDRMSSELFQQLISNNNVVNNKGRPRKGQSNNGNGGNNWLLDGQKAACVSQPSDSVLMNLLDSSNNKGSVVERMIVLPKSQGKNVQHRYLLRVNSGTEAAPITSLLSLTDKDYEMNAPVINRLLQGEDLIKALDVGDSTM